MVHAHVTLADAAGRAVGGHLAEGTPVFACEFIITEYLADQTLVRQNDPDTGLMLWPVASCGRGLRAESPCYRGRWALTPHFSSGQTAPGAREVPGKPGGSKRPPKA